MSDDEVMMSARIPPQLKRFVDADERTNQEVVEAALWREFGGERKAAIDRRIEEKKRRLTAVESEKNEREREIEEIKKDIDALEAKREEAAENREAKLQDAIEKAKKAPRNPENPAIREQAKRVGMDPEEFVDELPERDDDGPRSL